LNSFWADRRVWLTGGHGFLGTVLRRRIESANPAALFAPRKQDLDLLDRSAVRDFLASNRPDLVIHAAAVVGGIGANSLHPGRFFYENAMMGIQLIEESRLAGVKKFVCLGTICAYPKFTPVPFHEDNLWDGYPEETNAPYGVAKKALLVQLQAYRQEYGFIGTFLLPVNLYGPGDNFNLESSHVIPALIRKFVEAKAHGAEDVELWGDGSPTREFLFVDDAAEGIVLATEGYDGPLPVNLGSGDEIQIQALAIKVAKAIGYCGRIAWDTSKPNGQPRRMLDVTRARTLFGFQATTSFDVGLRRTIDWFLSNQEKFQGC
jgi:GDP-L-fucose synthase